MQLDRDELLEAAEALIGERGPDVSMADLAEASDITKPSLYRIVGDRDALLGALAQRLSDRINAAVAQALDPTAPPQAQLEQLLRAYFGEIDARRNVFLYVAADTRSVDRIPHVLAIAEISARPLSRTLRQMGASVDDAEAWSYAFVGASQLTTFKWLRDADQTIDQVVAQLCRFLWSGIGGNATP